LKFTNLLSPHTLPQNTAPALGGDFSFRLLKVARPATGRQSKANQASSIFSTCLKDPTRFAELLYSPECPCWVHAA
jgi:hypothetical protein